MFLTSSLSLITLLTTGAFAASTAELFLPTFPVVAYPVATGNGATTYLVGCTAGSDTSTCNFVQPYTLVQGQNTVQFALTVGQQEATLGCAIQGTTYLACSATGGSSGALLTAFTTFTGDAVATHFRGVAIETASSDLLTFPTPSSTSAPSSSSSPSPSSTSSSPSSTTTSSASDSTANFTSSIFELVAPTEAATTSSPSSLTSTEASSTGLGGSSTTGAVVSSTSTAANTKASASGLGNAGSRSVSCGLGWVVGGMLAVVGGVMV